MKNSPQNSQLLAEAFAWIRFVVDVIDDVIVGVDDVFVVRVVHDELQIRQRLSFLEAPAAVPAARAARAAPVLCLVLESQVALFLTPCRTEPPSQGIRDNVGKLVKCPMPHLPKMNLS